MVRWMTALVGLLAVGCGSAVGNIGRFDASGFRHERYRYGVQAGPDGAILSRDWRLDNFQQTSRRTVPKSGPAYRSDVGFDTDGDGEIDQHVELNRYDLRYRHVRNRGSIWLSTIPLSTNLSQTDLRVLMRDYVDAVSGAGFVGVNFGGTVVAGIERRFATRILDSQVITVHGLPGFAATVEVANVDQMQLSPDSRWERARVVLIRTPFEYAPPRSLTTVRDTHYPVVMLVGYTNLPEDFDAGLPDFVRFVNQIVFADAPPETPPGVQVVSSEPAPPAAAPPQAPPPAPPPPPAVAEPQDANEQRGPPSAEPPSPTPL